MIVVNNLLMSTDIWIIWGKLNWTTMLALQCVYAIAVRGNYAKCCHAQWAMAFSCHRRHILRDRPVSNVFAFVVIVASHCRVVDPSPAAVCFSRFGDIEG